MIDKPLDKITKDDIDSLVRNEVSEGRTIDYKAMLPGNSDSEKREFLADICSFANASGGDILFGVSEKLDSDRKNTGIPDKVDGIQDLNVDHETLRLDGMIRDGIAPRIPNVRIQGIDGFTAGPVLIIRIPKSWASPHMVTFKGSSRFYSRTNAGKYQMDVTELRSAFALSEALPDRIKRFRDDRLAKVVADETPVPLNPNPKTILHLLPLASFSIKYQLDPTTIRSRSDELQPIQGAINRSRFNVDGFVTSCRSKPPGFRDYCQVFRSGVIEAVDAEMTEELNGRKVIPTVKYEERLLRSVDAYLGALRAMEVPLPIVVVLSMLGVAGYELAVDARLAKMQPTPIDRDLLLLPDVLVEEYGCDVPKILRPIFDAVWNAGGYECSLNYDADGNWKPR